MKKQRIIRSITIITLVLMLLTVFVACENKEGPQGEQGIQGEPGLPGRDGVDGKDGVGITSIIKVSSSDNVDMYKISYSDGSESFFDVTNGVTGSTGNDGVGVVDVDTNEAGELIITFSNEETINVGKVVGSNGVDGVGIKDIAFNANGDFIITLTDNSTINCGKVPTCSHSYSAWNVVFEANCTSSGVKIRTCSKCGFENCEFIAATGHNYTDTVMAPTCTEHGCTISKCLECDYEYVHSYTVTVEHTYGSWTEMLSTCTTKILSKSCSACGSHVIESETGFWHNYTTSLVDPTCVSQGYTFHQCTKCVSNYKDNYVDATGHTYDSEIDAICNVCKDEREVDALLVSISNNNLFGYVKGLDALDQNKAIVVLYNSVNSYTTEVGENNEYYFNDVQVGAYYLKIEITGYEIPDPIKLDICEDSSILQHLIVSQVTNSDFYYQWKADDTYFGYEESATVPSEKTFTFLDEVIFVNDSSATDNLQRDYKIVLSNEELNWSSDYASRMFELVESIYAFPKSLPSKWILTSDEIDDDVEITYSTDSTVIRISKSAFENAIPRKAEYNGLKGTYFSNRLYHALIRYATKEGTDIYYIDRILQHDYGCSIIVNDYAALTAETTNETNAAFEMFKPEELLAILEMFAEMPQGLHRVENLEYLIRRIDGMPHPTHHQASAVSWPTVEHGYIEFMDTAFLGSEIEDTFRLVVHEKAHFLWEHLFSEELKAEWIDIGGWYQTDNDSDDWSTTKETEFVTAYSHAINPNEDMAESIAYYILMPDKLESRSPEKYEFIRNYIMNGEIYVTQIREDLTFEVYNLYPDYNYPGKIVGVEIQVVGDPEEDKQVTVTVKIDTHGDPSFGANRAVMRITSENGTYYDLWVFAIDETNSVLRGTVIFSKYACNGYWRNEEIELRDDTGNQRFVGVDNFGWKLYINNPLADSEPPQYEKDSLYVEMEAGEFNGRPVTYVYVKFNATDDNGIQHVYCSMVNTTHDAYRMDEYGVYNEETGEAIITYIFTEYTQSGEYSIRYISLTDVAKNEMRYYPNVTFTFDNENSDLEAPELDVNRIFITATPTHPENPNGETVVHIEYYVKDNASGLGVVHYQLLDPLGNTYFEYHYHENFYTTYFEGDPTAWTKYEIDVILPEGSAPGKWGLLEIFVSDKAGNIRTYNFLEILHFQVVQ